MREMIAAFRKLGHTVLLAAADTGGDRRPDEDFEVSRLPCPRSRMLGIDGRYLLANLRARAVLRQIADRFRPDAIYERSSLYFTAGEWLEKQTGLPRILEINALLADEQRSRLHFPSMAARYEARILRNSRATSAISECLKSMITKLKVDPGTIRLFPMAVDPARFKLSSEPNFRRRELGWPDDVTVIGYVGSMNTYHRPNWFMDLAEKMLRRDEKSIRFIVLGGSAVKVQRHRSRLYKFVEEGLVHFCGTVPQSEMVSWLSAMDVVLVPGAAPQATPTKIYETASVGRPLIAPATDPIIELCGRDAPNLFTPNDFNSLEDRVRDFLQSRTKFDEFAAALRQKVTTVHTWENNATGIINWFHELGAKTRG
ncbi:glycosyltransferase [Candidatus Sumerlaeota bacterium]|nr:glycosyltransferase [Candidatus Sumerlaeota bacterium]